MDTDQKNHTSWSKHIDTKNPSSQLSYAPSQTKRTMAEAEVQHLHVTYNNIHNLIRSVTPKIAAEFNPDLMIAIGERYIMISSSLARS
jgi:hypothetical protein